MENTLVSQDQIENKIFLIRGKRVILDRDLAKLYQVETRVLNQAVRRNIARFPEDFMFQLTKEEFGNLKSQFVTSSRGGLRKFPLAFTEQGVAMLSSVLNSERAIQVNIQITRTFVKLRMMIANTRGLRKKIEALERKYDEQFKIVFEAISQLLPEEKPKRRIGFQAEAPFGLPPVK